MTLKCELRESARVELPENQELSPNGQGSHERRRLKNDEEDEDEDEGCLPATPDRLLAGHQEDSQDRPPDDDDPLFCGRVYCEPMAGFLSLDEEPITARPSVDEGTKPASPLAVGGPIGTPLSEDG